MSIHRRKSRRSTDPESPVDSQIVPLPVQRSTNGLQLIQGGKKKEGRRLSIAEQKSVGYRFHELRQEFQELPPAFRTSHHQISDAIRNYYENGWYREMPQKEAA